MTDELKAEIVLCKEAVRHCMNGSGLQGISNDVWAQFAKARARRADARNTPFIG
jgi:hypothetical protein